MSDLESTDWSEIAANNIQPSPAGWPPNSSPNIVYTTDREMMGALKRDWNRRNAAVATGGSANAQTLNYAVNPTAMIRGQRYCFIATFQNTGPMTLAVGGLAATNVISNGAALVGGELQVGLITEVIFDGTQFQILASSSLLPSGGSLTLGSRLYANGGVYLNNTVASGTRVISGQTSGSYRWQMFMGDTAAETGGNSGSNLVVSRFDDTGTFIDAPLQITRSTGIASFRYPLQPVGYQIRNGTTGTFGVNAFNINWASPNLEAWIDNVKIGNITYTSDYRSKRDIAPLPSMWERVKALRPISYKHKDWSVIKGDDVEHWGFVAHELQETLTEDAATGHKEGEDVIQSPNLMTVVASLTKALQQAMARIEKLEARLLLAPETA